MLRKRLTSPWLVVGLLVGACAVEEKEPPPTQDDPRSSTTRIFDDHSGLDQALSLTANEIHLHRFDLPANTFLEFSAAQLGTDVALRWLDPDQQLQLEVDSPTGTAGVERLIVVTTRAGLHILEVAAFEAPIEGGKYQLQLTSRNPAGEAQSLIAEAARNFSDARRWIRQPTSADSSRTTAHLESAISSWLSLGETELATAAMGMLADLHSRERTFERAIEVYRQRQPLLDSTGQIREGARNLNQLASALREAGEVSEAHRTFSRALEAAQGAEDPGVEIIVLLNLGRLDGRMGHPVQALNRLSSAADLAERSHRRRALADILNIIGEIYGNTGEPELALDHHFRALDLFGAPSEGPDRARALSFIGRSYLFMKDLERAEQAYSEALALRETLDDPIGRAKIWTGLGRIAELRGEGERAGDLYRQALAVFEAQRLLLDEAILTNNLAWLAASRGDAEEAFEGHRRAFTLYRRIEHHEGQATSLLGMAKARRQQRRQPEALTLAERAIAKIEEVLRSRSLTSPLGDPGIPYLAARHGYYDLLVELLMDLHWENSEQGWDSLALAASEQSRTRHLLEALNSRSSQSAPGVRDGLSHQHRLRTEIESAERDLRRLSQAEAIDLEVLEETERQQRLRLAAFHRLAARSQRGDPWRASIDRPRTLALEQIQPLLGPGDLLLEYHLTEDRAFVWAVTATDLVARELAPARDIVSLARRLYQFLPRSHRITHRVPTQRALAALSRLLLDPVADRMVDLQRLIVVTDGVLAVVPFATLSVPAEDPGDKVPLIERYEVATLPSASVLAAIRSQRRARPTPEGLVAVVADPVFGAGDPRLANPPGGPAPHSPPRLVFTRREADAVLRIATPHGPTRAAFGFDAHRDLVRSGALGGFRIVHFATHGLLHADHPEFSALLFSAFDREGRRREGRLNLLDVHELTLPADLVVLSACRSALGPQVQGEGILGLPRGFLYAGASQVLVSLWNVQDESTAELMSRFYRALLEEGLRPSAALRAAQRSMSREARYSPFHWAGFVLQGVTD